MRRKNKVLEYITAKKYYLSLIGCLIITLVAVGIIYNKDQQYEEIANLNEVPQEQGLVENPAEKNVLTTEEAFEVVDSLPQISVHQEIVPDVIIEDSSVETIVAEIAETTTETTTESSSETTTDTTIDTTAEEVLKEVVETTSVPEEEEDGSLEVFVPVIEVQQPNLTFDIEEGFAKPVSGEIRIPYSNNVPVYFETLDQYKVSQGQYISAEIGTEVKAATDGVVETIEKQTNKGYTITLYHGNGFKSVYGQLKEDMNVKEGDLINKGAIIGYVEKPTTYYTLEGAHLYFEVLENGKTIDPEPLYQ